ncbi:hypothetical protein B0H17DRAFT_1133635 [Mycena rosella]|uniref:Uncharacterized protein n=1 Tax=Mycena rosella TaxID=1033263 RepID=A0AAD7GF41_MYCRO|nr:hypothetical protein B0H17DRAFT_1133635 [Mycena rosella]
MPIHNTNIQIGTKGPPGSWESFGDVVHPSCQCLPATSSESEISRSRGDPGPSSDSPTHGPFCSGSAALAATAIGEGQHPRSPTNPRNMTSTDHDSPWLMPISTAAAPDLWKTPNGYIANGMNVIPDIIMGDVEGMCSDSHTNNFNPAAGNLDSQKYYDNIDSLHIQSDRSPENKDTGQYHIPENWEELNIQIRQRNKPPKLARSASSPFERNNCVSKYKRQEKINP